MSKTARHHISEQDMADVRDAVLTKAKGGDTRAAAFIDRQYRSQAQPLPPLKLPRARDAGTLAEAQADVIEAAARRDITAYEGMAFAAMLDYRRRALDTVELEARLIELEKANAETQRLKGRWP
jgi:hypothetical protein